MNENTQISRYVKFQLQNLVEELLMHTLKTSVTLKDIPQMLNDFEHISAKEFNDKYYDKF